MMSNEHRGKAIARRRNALGMTYVDLGREAKIYRETVASAEAGDPATKERTLGALEAALDRLETAMTMDEVAATVELPNGARGTFVGPAEAVAEAARLFAGEKWPPNVPTQAPSPETCDSNASSASR